MVTIIRDQWTVSFGLSGRLPPDQVDEITGISNEANTGNFGNKRPLRECRPSGVGRGDNIMGKKHNVN